MCYNYNLVFYTGNHLEGIDTRAHFIYLQEIQRWQSMKMPVTELTTQKAKRT